ncbi:MAG: hypothetical protein IT176_15145 [Acidobacteria bacterium]|nr:hypothetical protein [Acidobacteriota bacterium]
MQSHTSPRARAAKEAVGRLPGRAVGARVPGSTEFILQQHDPRLRGCPAPRPGSLLEDRVCAALTWNVFQTLALIAPSFWLRRLKARLVGLDAIDQAPLEAAALFWEPLGTRPAAAGGHPSRADVLIETEHAVFGLMALFGRDLSWDASAEPAADPVLQLIDGVSFRAGVRGCYVGLVASDAQAPVAASLFDRYAGSRDGLARRLPARRDGLANICGIGRTTWTNMHTILRDCAGADVLDDLERYAASRTVRWLAAAGIAPAE